MYESMDFDALVRALRDEEQTFPALGLYRLADLSPDEARALEEIWPQLGLARRRALAEDMHELLEMSHQFSFREMGIIALRDPDPYIRKKAIEILWFEDDPQLIPLLLARLHEDSDKQVRALAAAALADYVFQGEVEELPRAQFTAIVEALLNVLRSEESPPEVRYRALEAVSFASSEPEVGEWIEQIYQQSVTSGDEEGLRAALFAMGRSVDPRWTRYVVLHLHDPRPSVRAEAATAAGRLEMVRVLPDLLELLEDANKYVRMAAAWALSELGGANEQVARALRKALRRAEDEEEAQMMAEALDNYDFQTSLVLGNLDMLEMTLQVGETDLLDVHLPEGVDLQRLNGHDHSHPEEAPDNDAGESPASSDDFSDEDARGAA